LPDKDGKFALLERNFTYILRNQLKYYQSDTAKIRFSGKRIYGLSNCAASANQLKTKAFRRPTA
jgi:hypothetical protein